MKDNQILAMEDFIVLCETGELTDADGCAQFSTGLTTIEHSPHIYPSEVKDERVGLTGYKAVIWHSNY